MSLALAIRRLAHAEDIELPAYASPGAAGLDLRAAVDNDLVLAAGAHVMVPTGFQIAVPVGYEAQIRPRSGLAHRHGITVLNSPGTIDADYRGEIFVLLVNLSHRPYTIVRGARIAQMVVAPVARVALEEVAELDATGRGAGGFGSTGQI